MNEALQAFRAGEGDAKLNIRAAKDTPFSAIQAVMKSAAAAGMDDYLYASYQGGES